jgi:hypothetical protein
MSVAFELIGFIRGPHEAQVTARIFLSVAFRCFLLLAYTLSKVCLIQAFLPPSRLKNLSTMSSQVHVSSAASFVSQYLAVLFVRLSAYCVTIIVQLFGLCALVITVKIYLEILDGAAALVQSVVSLAFSPARFLRRCRSSFARHYSLQKQYIGLVLRILIS